jgi:hypothetical protein
MDEDKTKRRTRSGGRARRRVDPGGSKERELVGRASGRLARNLVDADDSGSATELMRLKLINKKDGGDSPREVTVQWVETEDEAKS